MKQSVGKAITLFFHWLPILYLEVAELFPNVWGVQSSNFVTNTTFFSYFELLLQTIGTILKSTQLS